MRILTASLAAGIVAGAAASAAAQAFMPPKGEATISLVASDALIRRHLLPSTVYDRGHSRSQTSTIATSYGLTDRIAISASIPDVRSKYYGTHPHQRSLDDPEYRVSPDDGNYHSTWQDFGVDVRYRLKHEGVVITPYVALSQPSHSYEYFAHSAAGLGLRQLELGSYVAGTLDSLLPGMFVQARYGYAISERALGISHNQSKVDVEAGYFVTPSLRFFGLGIGHVTHGGIDLSLAPAPPLPYEVLTHHDQIARENALNIGGGAAMDLNDSIAVFASALRTVAGRNTHALDYAVTLGVTFTVRKGLMYHPDHGMNMGGANAKATSLKKCRC